MSALPWDSDRGGNALLLEDRDWTVAAVISRFEGQLGAGLLVLPIGLLSFVPFGWDQTACCGLSVAYRGACWLG
jgi:hypothetical protein